MCKHFVPFRFRSEHTCIASCLACCIATRDSSPVFPAETGRDHSETTAEAGRDTVGALAVPPVVAGLALAFEAAAGEALFVAGALPLAPPAAQRDQEGKTKIKTIAP